MGVFAIDLNDTEVTAVGEAGQIYAQPGYALINQGALSSGEIARKNSRYHPRRVNSRFWQELSTESIADERFYPLSTADLASAQLDAVFADGERGDVIFAVPPHMDRTALGILLGIASELKLNVAGLIDSALAATRRPYPGYQLLHIDIGLHATFLTRLGQNELSAQVEKHSVVQDVGISTLNDTWIRAIAGHFVKQSRFDPLHDAKTEQTLLDELPRWMRSAANGDAVAMKIETGTIEHVAELDAIEFINLASGAYQQIANQARVLVRADEKIALQFTQHAAALPGFVDFLAARLGGEAFVLESGGAARGAFARAGQLSKETGARVLRSLAFDQPPLSAAPVENQALDIQRPTHVLVDDRAYPISKSALVIGSQIDSGEFGVELPAGLNGVSRRHCAFAQKNGHCQLQDLSRYGTFLNGHKIESSTIVHSGDTVRVGTPGAELRLIYVSGGHES